MRAAAIGVLFLTAACGDWPRARTNAEIEDATQDAVEDFAGPEVAKLNSQIADLESEVRRLKAENDLQRAELERLTDNDRITQENFETLFENDKKIGDRLNR